jgi:hypothetical protein
MDPRFRGGDGFVGSIDSLLQKEVKRDVTGMITFIERR